MTSFDKLYVGGQWVSPAGPGVIEVRSPHDLRPVGTCPEASPADVDAAVAAARRAFDEGPWPHTPPAERAKVLTRVSQLVLERSTELTELISAELGQTPGTVGMIQITPTLAVLDYYASLAETFAW